jgi:nicotinamide-nucleotide amidase
MTQSIEENVRDLVKEVADRFQVEGLKLTTAESCTGGWIAQVVTSLAGSSNWFDSGFVTYSNAAKQKLLGVPVELFEEGGPGAVSKETVRAMTAGALANTTADVVVATSGIAGPDGGSDEKPVGTVWIGWASRDGRSRSRVYHFEGDRYSIRLKSVEQALRGIIELLDTTMLPR